MKTARHLLLTLAFVCAVQTHAGNATRIQLVVDVPSQILTVVDEAGDITGDIDGIATDALHGAVAGEFIAGARLKLSVDEIDAPAAWGHVNDAGQFVEGLKTGGIDGSYTQAQAQNQPEDTLLQIYTPPVEFDLSGANTAHERDLNLAVRIQASAEYAIVLSKPLVLVKPPVVLVHGINSGPGAWTAFAAELDGNRGFRSFRVDHSGGAFNSGAPTYGGNGDVHDSYAFVRGGMPESSGVAEALSHFRNGHPSAHDGKKIVVQKVDIVASSYGGLLSRWYIEQAPDYDNNVRKLITLGTPHRGTPLTNMDVQVLKDPVIASADSQFFSPFVSMAGTLQLIDDFGFLRWKDGSTPAKAVPALEVMTVGSEVLGLLNNIMPFHDDVAYGSIVGTNNQIDFLSVPALNGFYDLEPTRSILGAQKSYFPWMRVLDASEGDSDAIVPVWSQTLPARATNVPLDHISYHDSLSVQNIVALWLQDSTLPKGYEHRPAFLTQNIPDKVSRENAYVGSQLIGNQSVGGGLVNDAIVQVNFSGPTLTSNGNGLAELGSTGGIVIATMTGMLRVETGNAPIADLTLVQDGYTSDSPLDNVSATINANATPIGQLVSFAVEARIGRTQSGSILGPDGSASGIFSDCGVWSVGYEISGQPDFSQAPWTDIDLPCFALPAPFVPTENAPFIVGPAPGSPFTLQGGVHANASGAANQAVTSVLYEDNYFSDTVLENRTFNVAMPANTITGALMPYSEPNYFLYKNTGGYVEGANNSSGETNASVYQYLIQPNTSNPSSATIAVGVTP